MDKADKLLRNIFDKNNISFDSIVDYLYVDKVKLNRKKQILKICLISKKFTLESKLEKLIEIFEEKFPQLKVDLCIRYDISEDKQNFMKEYWNNILYNIERAYL